MKKTTVKIDGMMCGMCEAHVSDVIRRNFKVKKVSASHVKNSVEIISEEPVKKEALESAFAPTGYKIISVEETEYQKKGLFFFFKKK